MAALHADLTAKGVNFVYEPENQPWGVYAIVEDSEGNKLILVELPRE
jgi:predicted enzyme related to lactoylglutathione lyase